MKYGAQDSCGFLPALPDELLLRIFSLLGPLECARIARVCRRLRDVCLDPSLWREVRLSRRSFQVAEAAAELACAMSSWSLLQSLDVSFCAGLPYASLLRLLSTPECRARLIHLDLSAARFDQAAGEQERATGALLGALAACSALRSLHLSWLSVPSSALASAMLPVGLKRLSLDEVGLQWSPADAGAALCGVLVACSALESLSLRCTTHAWHDSHLSAFWDTPALHLTRFDSMPAVKLGGMRTHARAHKSAFDLLHSPCHAS